jgi:hypothetical protein
MVKSGSWGKNVLIRNTTPIPPVNEFSSNNNPIARVIPR